MGFSLVSLEAHSGFIKIYLINTSRSNKFTIWQIYLPYKAHKLLPEGWTILSAVNVGSVKVWTVVWWLFHLLLSVSLLFERTQINIQYYIPFCTNRLKRTTYTPHSVNYKNPTPKDFSTFYTKLANSSHNSKNKTESRLDECYITNLHMIDT